MSDAVLAGHTTCPLVTEPGAHCSPPVWHLQGRAGDNSQITKDQEVKAVRVRPAPAHRSPKTRAGAGSSSSDGSSGGNQR